MLWPVLWWPYWFCAIALGFALAIVAKRARDAGKVRRERLLGLLGLYVATVILVAILPSIVYGTAREFSLDITKQQASFWSSGAGLALLALVLGAWALLGDPAKGRQRCPKCWYDMSASPTLICPECGRDAKRPERLLKTRRRKRWAAAAALLLALAAATAFTPHILDDTWPEYVPDVALIVAMPWMDDGPMAEELSHRLGGMSALLDGLWEPSWPVWKRRLAVNRATAMLRRSDTWAVQFGLELLVGMGPDAVRAMPAVEPLLTHSDVDVRNSARWLVGELPGMAQRAYELTIEALKDPDQRARFGAVMQLGVSARNGEGLLAAPSALIALARTEPDIRLRTLALRQIGFFAPTPEVVEMTLQLTRDPDRNIHAAALRSLVNLAPSDPRTTSAVVAALSSPDPFVASNAGYSIWRGGPTAPEVLRALEAAVRTHGPNNDSMDFALEFIAKQEPRTDRVDFLLSCLAIPRMCFAATHAIASMQEHAATVLPQLRTLSSQLQTRNPECAGNIDEAVRMIETAIDLCGTPDPPTQQHDP